MSLLFMEGFDHSTGIADYVAGKWSAEQYSKTISPTYKRNGINGIYCSGSAYLRKTGLGQNTTLIAGFGFYLNDSSPSSVGTIFYFLDSGSEQLHLSYTNDYRLRVYRTGTLLGESSADVISSLAWYYIEFKATINNSTGSFEVRVNGTSILSDSGVDTQNTSNAYSDAFQIIGADAVWFDDLYICNDSGTLNNDFLGDCVVETIYPDGAGNSTQWTPVGEASNYLCVDDTTPDDDSTYVTSSGTSELDLYTYDNISVGVAEVYGVQILPFARKDDAGEVTLDHYVRVNSTDYVVGSGAMGDSYVYYPVLLEESPDTSTQWTLDEINALEVGVNRSE